MGCDLLVIADVLATVVEVGVPLLLTGTTGFVVDPPVAHDDVISKRMK